VGGISAALGSLQQLQAGGLKELRAGVDDADLTADSVGVDLGDG
jgi:hypothetical protein